MPDASPARAVRPPADRSGTGAPPPNLGSRVGNGRDLFLGEDNRSAASRRQRELCQEYALPWGGWAALQGSIALAPIRRLVKRAAVLTVTLERLGGAATRGEVVDPAVVVSVSNAVARAEDALAAAAPKAREPTLADLLATMAQELDAA